MRSFKTVVEIAAFIIVFALVNGGLMLLYLRVLHWNFYLSGLLAAVPALLLAKRARLMCRSAS